MDNHRLIGTIMALVIAFSGIILPSVPPAQAQGPVYDGYARMREMAFWSGDRAFQECISPIDGTGVRYHCGGYPETFTLPDGGVKCEPNGQQVRGPAVVGPTDSVVCWFDGREPRRDLPTWNARHWPGPPATTPTPGQDPQARMRELAWWAGDQLYRECLSVFESNGVRYHCGGHPRDFQIPDSLIKCESGESGKFAGPARVRSESISCKFEGRAPRTDLPTWSPPSIPPAANPTPAPPTVGTRNCDPANLRLHRPDSPFLLEVRASIVPSIRDNEAYILCEQYQTSDGVWHYKENEFSLHMIASTPRPVTPVTGVTFQFGSGNCSASPCDGRNIGPFISDGVVMRWARNPVVSTPTPTSYDFGCMVNEMMRRAVNVDRANFRSVPNEPNAVQYVGPFRYIPVPTGVDFQSGEGPGGSGPYELSTSSTVFRFKRPPVC